MSSHPCANGKSTNLTFNINLRMSSRKKPFWSHCAVKSQRISLLAHLCQTWLARFCRSTKFLQLVQAISQELHLLVGLGILYFQVRILILQLPKFVGHPVFDSRSLRFDGLCVRQSQGTLKNGKVRTFHINMGARIF